VLRSHRTRTESTLPRRSPTLFALFGRYCRRYVARHFHAVRVSRSGPIPEIGRRPIVIIVNHASWWDPLIGLIVSQHLPDWRIHYAPIEQQGLEQYRILERLGFFGIHTGTRAGGLQFLRKGLAILAIPESTLWVTAQGQFVDVRDRPITLKEGVGHLAHRCRETCFVPMAIEYPYWNDRLPEALVRFGRLIEIENGLERSPLEWTKLLGTELEHTQDRLATEARTRDPRMFETILGGSAGVGGIYDIWRRLRSAVTGRQFQPEHLVEPLASDNPSTADLPYPSSEPSTSRSEP
jgi:1-acyl-sn-glycerol-3-phosphate acyltransferase